MAWRVNGADCAETASVLVAVTVTSSRTGVPSSARATAVLPDAHAAIAMVLIALWRICMEFFPDKLGKEISRACGRGFSLVVESSRKSSTSVYVGQLHAAQHHAVVFTKIARRRALGARELPVDQRKIGI